MLEQTSVPVTFVEHRTTKWKNPTQHTLKIDVLLKANTLNSEMTRIVFEPGEVKDLDSKFDPCLQQLDKDGMIVGGLAPHLLNLTTGQHKISEDIDEDAQTIKRLERAKQEAAASMHVAELLTQEAARASAVMVEQKKQEQQGKHQQGQQR